MTNLQERILPDVKIEPAEDMLKSAVIEEKKFKHNPWAGADNPWGPKFLCQQEGLITMVICCKFKKNLFKLTLYTSFHDLINVYSPRSGADNHRGQILMSTETSSLRSFATSLKELSLKPDFIKKIFMILYMYITMGQGLTTPLGRKFDVNRNIFSLRSFVASLKKISLKSDFIHFFSWFNTCI